MLYKPSEVAEELGAPLQTIHDWTKQDLPHERDNRGHLWINGQRLADWINQKRQARRGPPLGQHEAYCLPCRMPVRLVNPGLHSTTGKQVLLSGTCPHCGGKIYKGGAVRGQS